jgi:hypothetical protein
VFRALGSRGIDHQCGIAPPKTVKDPMTGGINCVSWNPSTVNRRKLTNNESAPLSAKSGLEFAQALSGNALRLRLLG